MSIGVAGLRKAFGEKVVLDGIDLEVRDGTTFCLLGPNGAGKTTAVRILSTLIGFDGGQATVAGHDVATEPDAVRAAIGVTGQFSAVDNLLTGEENLLLMADLHHLNRTEGRQRASELLERFDLTDAGAKLAGTYSGGMRRRLDLAMTLVGDPSVIFLDEPTTGLDPRSRRMMWQTIRGLVADGVTIFLTTQYLEEADELADQIAVLDHGKIVAAGTADELKRGIPGGHVRLRFHDATALDSASRLLTPAISRDDEALDSASRLLTPAISRDDEALDSASRILTTVISRDDEALTLDVPSDGGVAAVRGLLEQLDQAGLEVEEFSVHTPDLEDVFFALTGHPTTAEEAVR